MTSVSTEIPLEVRHLLSQKMQQRAAQARTGMLHQDLGDGGWLDLFFDEHLATPHILGKDASIPIDGSLCLYFLSLNPDEVHDLATADQHLVGCTLLNPTVTRHRGWQRKMRLNAEGSKQYLDLVWCGNLQGWRYDSHAPNAIKLIKAREMRMV